METAEVKQIQAKPARQMDSIKSFLSGGGAGVAAVLVGVKKNRWRKAEDKRILDVREVDDP